MTELEFSNEFDVLINSQSFRASLGIQASDETIHLDEYEKSVYLTDSQDQIVKELYTGYYTGRGYENYEDLRRQLDALVTQEEYTESDLDSPLLVDDKFTHLTHVLPNDCWYIVYEQAVLQDDDKCINNKVVDVLPVKHDDYSRIRRNPFRGPNTRRILRLDNADKQIELVTKYNIGKYIIRYLKKPEPIVTAQFPDDISIDGVNSPQTCKLSELLHRDILERAVTLALQGRKITKQG